MRLRNSLAVELTLIVIIYAVGIPMREYLAVDASTWARTARRLARRQSVAGRLVACAGQRAGVPVPVAALVLSRVHLGALPLAGVAASI